MTAGKGLALSVALAGAFALGAWLRPQLTTTPAATTMVEVPVSAAASPTEPAPAPAPAAPTTATATAKAGSDTASPGEARVLAISASAESVQRRARTLLSFGTDVKTAASGFRNAEQFMTLAYAAKNTEIPFVLLKHRVLTEGKSLADAIRELKPGLDATLEANRARLEARSELSRLN
jgi:hypothetical protein